MSESSRLLPTVLPKLAMVLAGACWVALASTLCGCGVGSGFVMNESGKGYYQSGNYNAAAVEFSRATLDNPINPNYAHNLAKTLHKQGRLGEAEHQYRRALAIDPRHQPAYNGLACLMHESGRSGEAYALLSSWVSTQPHLPAAHIELAALQQRQGNLQGAESSLRQALATDPGNSIALAHMGELMRHSGRTPEAVSYYRQSLARNPFQSEVGTRLATLTTPSQPIVRQAAYAPAPQMIAGRTNPAFVPQMASYRPAIPFAAPPYTTRGTAMSLWVPSTPRQATRPWSQTPISMPASSTYNMMPANMVAGGPIRPTATYGQPSFVQTGFGQQFGQPQRFATPGTGQLTAHSQPTSTAVPHVTYQIPGPAPSMAPTSMTPTSISASQSYPTQLTPLPAPSLAAPQFAPVPEPVLGRSVPLTPAVHNATGSQGSIQQINYAVPTVPAF